MSVEKRPSPTPHGDFCSGDGERNGTAGQITYFPSQLSFTAVYRQLSLQTMDKDKNKNSRIVVVGAGVFGLSIAHQLACEGYKDVVVLDRHMPPVHNP
jgi:NADPH-dependent 2,4-dienoyl-CoA reductase/sulfur reductase-like enzyme